MARYRPHPNETCHLCQLETPERGQTWPDCRDCMEPTCLHCEVPKSRQDHDYDVETETGCYAVCKVDVQCQACDAQDQAEDVAEGAVIG